MPNNFFRFKEFTVYQEHCAMKVCTDACLFGAMIGEELTAGNYQLSAKQRCLDIGTGTGLLSLMLAQKDKEVIIDAVEIDKTAAVQAGQNFHASPWKERLNIYHSSIQLFSPAPDPSSGNSVHSQYDFIFSNPPFFENDLKSRDTKRNIALHNDALSLEELVNVIKILLKKDGRFAVLLPFHRTDYFIDLCAANNFYPYKKVLVKQTTTHCYFRSIIWFSADNPQAEESDICIKDAGNEYTEAFATVLKDYYLKL